jgi:hypothetical protein
VRDVITSTTHEITSSSSPPSRELRMTTPTTIKGEALLGIA